jgi:hypothetical protein
MSNTTRRPGGASRGRGELDKAQSSWRVADRHGASPLASSVRSFVSKPLRMMARRHVFTPPSLRICACELRHAHRSSVYTGCFREILETAGVNVVRLPARSPNLNAFAERFVRSVRSECLARVIPLGERHLRHMLTEYVEHYHKERNHQGLGNHLIEPLPANTNAGDGAVQRRERLGGVLTYLYWDAA